MIQVSHDPRRCRDALAGTANAVVVDLETTGVRRKHRIVSAGVLVDGIPFVLFARSMDVSVRNLPLADFRDALRPLERTDLIVIAHNANFDYGFLLREGIRIGGEVHDTMRLLRLLDQDRGGEKKGSSRHRPRRDLMAPKDAPKDVLNLNYKLKCVVGQFLGLKMRSFPGRIDLAPYNVHATYLASDLVGTKRLHDYLWPKLGDGLQTYYQQLVAPLIPILCDMTDCGVATDQAFVTAECQRLEGLMNTLSEEHQRQYGLPLGMKAQEMNDWLFRTLGLPVLKKKRQGRKWVPSLEIPVLRELQDYSEDPRALGSLELIQDFRQVAGLIKGLRPLSKYIDRQTGRFHSTFDDRQSSGRISSTYPNLQALAKEKTIQGEDFRSRDVLRASDGYELVAFDIAQADIRVLAHAVESFPRSGPDYQEELRRRRWEMLGPEIGPFYAQMQEQANPSFVGQGSQVETFDPRMSEDLAADFFGAKDIYTMVATRFLDREPVGGERKTFKEIMLSIVFGLSAPSLAKKLKCTNDEAKQFLADFETTYPKVAAYKQLMYRQIAWTGQTFTFMGRSRTVTAHRWLVTEPRVKMLVSYRGGDAYWLDVVPLRPSLRVLTTFVRRAWNARTGRLIYDSQRGRLSEKPYSIFDAEALQYRLPIRNWGWRSIRRVRARGEEADYEGFDATARAAFNFICQGGTADISKLMMIRSQPICKQFGARLLIQIHDELVFEVPKERAKKFVATMKKVLEEPPVKGFAVPIVVEPKRGPAFGSLEKVPDSEL